MTNKTARARARARQRQRQRLAVFSGIGREVGVEGGRQVFPGGVDGFDQGDLLGAGPVLEFGFAGESVDDVLMVLVVDEAVDVVLRRVGPGWESR